MTENTRHLPHRYVPWNVQAQPTSNRDRRRIAMLERQAPELTKRAAEARAPIDYLGTAPLFTEPRACAGPQTDWVIVPASYVTDTVVPTEVRDKLLRLDGAGIYFPLIYIAHEVPKGKIPVPTAAGSEHVVVDRATAERAIGSVPPSAAAIAIADRVGHRSQALLTVLRSALPIAGALLATPLVIAGAAVGALVSLDPIVFGVIPAGPQTQGTPAAWYVLASWQWGDSC
jgi:hypothetical protein